jgi:hypothetical protein
LCLVRHVAEERPQGKDGQIGQAAVQVFDYGVQLFRLVQVVARVGHPLDDLADEAPAVGTVVDLVEKLADGRKPRRDLTY